MTAAVAPSARRTSRALPARGERGVLRRQSLGDRARHALEAVRDAIDPRTRQFISDLVASVRESPNHVKEFITGDLWDAIREHWPSILGVTLGILAVEGIIAALGVAPTGVTQIIAAILEVIVIAVLGYFAGVELVGVYEEGERWWLAARRANGDATQISEASRAFVRMVWHILMAVLTLAGVRARVRGGAIGRIAAPFEKPPPTAPGPPRLRSIDGGNSAPVEMKAGKVVSNARTNGRGQAPRSSARLADTEGSLARAPEPMPETLPAEPVVRPAPRLRPGTGAPASTPKKGPGVQPVPALAAGTAVATAGDGEDGARAYPIYWPEIFGPPALFGAPITVFHRTPQAERDYSYGVTVRRELWARAGRDPDLFPPNYHAHHIVPLFLGGMEGARGNIMFLPAVVHRAGHALLHNQPQMENPPPPLPPLPRNILNPAHVGATYVLAGMK